MQSPNYLLMESFYVFEKKKTFRTLNIEIFHSGKEISDE